MDPNFAKDIDFQSTGKPANPPDLMAQTIVTGRSSNLQHGTGMVGLPGEWTSGISREVVDST